MNNSIRGGHTATYVDEECAPPIALPAMASQSSTRTRPHNNSAVAFRDLLMTLAAPENTERDASTVVARRGAAAADSHLSGAVCACHHHSAARARGLCAEPHGRRRVGPDRTVGGANRAGSGVGCRPRTRSGVRHAGDAGDLIGPPARGPSGVSCASAACAARNQSRNRADRPLLSAARRHAQGVWRRAAEDRRSANRAAGHRHEAEASFEPVQRIDLRPAGFQRGGPDPRCGRRGPACPDHVVSGDAHRRPAQEAATRSAVDHRHNRQQRHHPCPLRASRRLRRQAAPARAPGAEPDRRGRLPGDQRRGRSYSPGDRTLRPLRLAGIRDGSPVPRGRTTTGAASSSPRCSLVPR